MPVRELGGARVQFNHTSARFINTATLHLSRARPCVLSPRFNLFRLPPAQRGWILTSTSASELSPWPLNAHSR